MRKIYILILTALLMAPAYAADEIVNDASFYSSFENREKVVASVIDRIREEEPKTKTADPEVKEFYSLVARLEKDDAYFMLLDFYDALLLYRSSSGLAQSKQSRALELLFDGISRGHESDLQDWLAGRIGEDISAADCTSAMKHILVTAIRTTRPSKNLILLAAKSGAAESLLPELKKIASSNSSPSSDPASWGALVALARCGDKDAVNAIINEFSRADDISYKISVLMPDLAYAPVPDIVLVLKQYLENDYAFSSDGNPSQIVPPANYAADALFRMLGGFPGKQDVFAYTRDDIEKCRQWMNSQKEFFYK